MDRFFDKNDTEYAYANSWAAARSNKLISRVLLRRMVETPRDDEVYTLLEECGYPGINAGNWQKVIEERRRMLFADFLRVAPDPRLVDLIRLKYDYHNLKTAIKGRANPQASDYWQLLMDNGVTPTRQLIDNAADAGFGDLPLPQRNAALAATEILSRTKNPRLADTVLERAMYRQQLALANAIGNSFIVDYVRLDIDILNLCTAIRLKQIGQPYTAISDYFIDGGSIAAAKLKQELNPELMQTVYGNTFIARAGAAAARVLRHEAGLAALDIAADNCRLSFLQQAQYTFFGPEPIFAYVFAAEQDNIAVSVLLTARREQLQPEEIMERLRDPYV